MSHRTRRTGRRSRWASALLLAVGLAVSGGAYAAVSGVANADESATASSQSQLEEGQKLFAANCATCHGTNLEGTNDGPSLIGVGSAAVDFQVGTGRMPMANQAAQAPAKEVQFTDEQIAALAAYVGSVSTGPSIPDEEYLSGDGDVAHGAELFRTNCAMCHNVSGAGGALTEGKYAPALDEVTPQHIYEAMVTGPQNMPVFSDTNLSADDKADIISYLLYLRENDSPGGIDLGNLGPVAEGLFLWIIGLGIIVGFTVWLASKPN